MSHFPAYCGKPLFTVWAFKIDSRPIGNEAILVLIRVLVKIS